jgi:hypothetical protein
MSSSCGKNGPGNRSATRTLPLLVTLTSVFLLAASQPGVVGKAFAAARLQAANGRASGPAATMPMKDINDRVIVFMKSQPKAIRPGTAASAMRSAAIANSQAPLLDELRRTHAIDIRTYRLVNAFAATVSAAEAASLGTNPNVAQVIPDVLIQGGSPGSGLGQLTSTAHAADRAKRPRPATRQARLHVIPGACGKHGRVSLDEAVQATQTASTNPAAKTARSLGITGAGVRVGLVADGLDPHNVNFIRADGRSIFNRSFGGDYKIFTADGPGQLTSGAEAFVDANAIAGQGLHAYDVRDFSTQPDPSACDVRIEGVAPGAAVDAFDVFGTYNLTMLSNILQAISYAVETDHVNVMNESLGTNPFPDSSALNALKQFNDAAVAAGTTVTVATGDSGNTDTIDSPGSDPKVIAVGASTTFRFYAQTNFAGARYFASKGWLDDNVSSLSSSGFTEAGGTIDLVAPGDLDFASCSTDVSLFAGCMNFQAQPSPVELSGGTSEAAPLTAGAAALVIQAFRQTHFGTTPTPALVKQILTSTATDLGLPASEQGAGLLNTYKAVLLAESIKTIAAAPAPVGNTLLLSRGHLDASGWPGSKRRWQFKVTNTGTDPQLVVASGRTFGPDADVQAGSVRLKDGVSPHFTDYTGMPDNYAVFHFTVRRGADRMDASIAYRGSSGEDPFSRVPLMLVDPRGRLVADSFPQGTSDSGSVDVRAPAPGVWTGVVSSVLGAYLGTTGKVLWRVATQRFTGFGRVQPRAFFLLPGHSQTLHVTERLPVQAGDLCGSIVLRSSLGGTDRYVGAEASSIPVVLRSMVNLSTGGDFGGMLTGGNGRAPGIGQIAYFEFRVGPGHRSITANMSLSNDGTENVGAYLVAPDDQALGFGQNNTLPASSDLSLTADALNPVPGTWTLVVDVMEPLVGNEISQRFYGHIRLDSARAVSAHLPDSPKRLLKRGTKLSVPVRITNTSRQTQEYFIDARLAKKTSMVLDSFDGQTFLLPVSSVQPYWLVPSDASAARVTARATLPMEFDWGPSQGDPDMLAPPSPGNRAVGVFAPSGGVLQPGIWIASPDELGPYRHAAKPGSTTMAMTVTAKAFDPAVTSPPGDFWQLSVDVALPFTPVTVRPGKSTVIHVTIRPTGKPGTVVRGDLYVDDYLPGVPPYGQQTADELVAIPYAYTIR